MARREGLGGFKPRASEDRRDVLAAHCHLLACRKNNAGADADLMVLSVLSTEGMVEETIVAGETVFHGRDDSHVR